MSKTPFCLTKLRKRCVYWSRNSRSFFIRTGLPRRRAKTTPLWAISGQFLIQLDRTVLEASGQENLAPPDREFQDGLPTAQMSRKQGAACRCHHGLEIVASHQYRGPLSMLVVRGGRDRRPVRTIDQLDVETRGHWLRRGLIEYRQVKPSPPRSRPCQRDGRGKCGGNRRTGHS